MKKYLLLTIISIFLFSGCTWVQLSPGGKNVRNVSASEVARCKKIGRTTVSLLDKVASINRSQTKVAAELDSLGRNSASEMGGDTIVPASGIKDGEQSFDVYKCVNQ